MDKIFDKRQTISSDAFAEQVKILQERVDAQKAKLFFEAVKEGFIALESPRRYRPMTFVGSGLYPAYDHWDMSVFIKTIAVKLGHLKESDTMTDYGSMRDEEVESIPDPRSLPKGQRCSTSNHFGKFINHLVALKLTLKAAEADGFCLDELLNALKDFDRAIEKV